MWLTGGTPIVPSNDQSGVGADEPESASGDLVSSHGAAVEASTIPVLRFLDLPADRRGV
jgi:hypothetical protein